MAFVFCRARSFHQLAILSTSQTENSKWQNWQTAVFFSTPVFACRWSKSGCSWRRRPALRPSWSRSTHRDHGRSTETQTPPETAGLWWNDSPLNKNWCEVIWSNWQSAALTKRLSARGLVKARTNQGTLTEGEDPIQLTSFISKLRFQLWKWLQTFQAISRFVYLPFCQLAWVIFHNEKEVTKSFLEADEMASWLSDISRLWY